MTFLDTSKHAFPYLLLVAYGLFTCGYFFFEDYSDHYRFFARFVFPLGLFVFLPAVRQVCRHRVFQAIAAYLVYLLLTGLWQEPVDWYRLGQKATISVYIVSFITITYFLVQWNSRLFQRLLQVCVFIAALAAATSFVVFYAEHPFPGERLVGLGALTNVNEFSNVYGVFGLLAMGFALRTSNPAYRVLLLATIVIFLSYAWFGQSRTAFVSLIFALLVMVAMTVQDKRILYAAMAVLGVFAAALFLLFPDTVEQAVLRGRGLRPQIWSSTWEQALLTPIAGHGLTSTLSVQLGRQLFETAHNAYLQVFWHGGIVGLLLHLYLLLTALRYAWSLAQQRSDYTVLCMLLFVAATMMTGVDTLIERPRDQWMLAWFPLALIISYQPHSAALPATSPVIAGKPERALRG